MKNEIDDKQLLKTINEAKPQSLGVIKANDLVKPKKPTAVLFIPEGASLDNEDLNIEIVGMNAATMAAMVARRC